MYGVGVGVSYSIDKLLELLEDDGASTNDDDDDDDDDENHHHHDSMVEDLCPLVIVKSYMFQPT